MTEPKPSASGKHVRFAMDEKIEDTKIGEGGAEPGDVDVVTGQGEGIDAAIVNEVHGVDVSGDDGVMYLLQHLEYEETQLLDRSRGRLLATMLRRHEDQAIRDLVFDSEMFWPCTFAIVGLTLFHLVVYLHYYVF